MSKKIIKNRELDVEWVQLIWQAKEFGITKEEIRKFINRNKMGSSDSKLGNTHT